MISLLRRSSARYLLRHPWALGLAIAGVALGVAVFVAISLANASANRAFGLSMDAVTGRATHQLRGGSDGLSDKDFARLQLAFPAVAMAPIVETRVSVPVAPGRLFLFLGVDTLAEAPFRSYLALGAAQGDLANFLTRPGAAAMAAETATGLGLRVGDPVPIEVGGRTATLHLDGLLSSADSTSRNAVADLIVVDIATAQEVLGRLGQLDRIDLLIPDDARGRQTLAELERSLPAGATLSPAGARAATMVEMTRAFQLNLRALSLLAMLCGAFLIFNTATFSVVQRRTLIGSLRALGVTRREIFRLVLAEAALIGTAGSLLGVLLGIAGSRSLVRLVSQTINDLYFALEVRQVSLDPGVLLVGFALGLGATLLATLPAAHEATQGPARAVQIRSLLEGRSRRGVRLAARIGVGGILLGAALFAIPSRNLPLAFFAFFLVLVGCACLAPIATVGFCRMLRPLLARVGGPLGALGRLAVGGVESSLSRTAAAIAALMMAVAVTSAVGVMITSFRSTLVTWLESVLAADLYLSTGPPSAGGTRSVLPDDLVDAMRTVPGVDRINTLLLARPLSEGVPIFVQAVDLDARGLSSIALAKGAKLRPGGAFDRGEEVLVSEPLAYRRGLDLGDTIELSTDRGPRNFRIGGIFSDYGSGQGAVLISRIGFEPLWRARGATALAVFVQPGTDLQGLARRLQALAGDQGLRVEAQATRTLKTTSLEIFDRTFQITVVLRLLAAAVAFLGVIQALMALQLERTRELGVLRVEGLTPRQLGGLISLQTGLMGLVAGLLSLPVALVMAWIMIAVINRRSFGWTLELHIPPGVLAEGVGIALAAALLAGLYPAWRMARLSPAEAVRDE